MADNDVQDMVGKIQRAVPRMSEMTSAELNAHLADINNNPSQYGLTSTGAEDLSTTVANAIREIREQHSAAADPGGDVIMDFGLGAVHAPEPHTTTYPPPDTTQHHEPGGDLIMNFGLGSVDDPSTVMDDIDAELPVDAAQPGAPVGGGDDGLDDPADDPNNIDDLFDPSPMGPNATVPGTPPPMDPDLQDLIHQTDALPAPPGEPAVQGVDVQPAGDPGDSCSGSAEGMST
jgi:hypothetical protein